jgi:hypothetical protein
MPTNMHDFSLPIMPHKHAHANPDLYLATKAY